MNFIKKLFLCFFLLGLNTTINAQFWKKIKKKLEKKVEQKIEKETDKVIDSTLFGKKDKNVVNQNKNVDSGKSYGYATINHSVLYGTITMDKYISKTKVNKEGNKVKIIGNWATTGGDVWDGYIITIKNVNDINSLTNSTFKIPEEATVQLDYDALVKGGYDFNQKERAPQQQVMLENGTVTVTFTKDKSVALNFSGDSKIRNHQKQKTNDESYWDNNTPVKLLGNINTQEPVYTITKVREANTKKQVNKEISNDEAMKLMEKVSPTVNIPSTFAFNKTISVEITDNRSDKYPLEFLLGDYPDIYAISVAAKEMQGQGTVYMVMTPKSSTTFMDMGMMKIRRSSSIDQLGTAADISERIPEDGDFTYKKTGNIKTILGYTCEEWKVDYDYTNAKGSASFWVSKDFPIQNKELPMLGMKMNNTNFQGFVLEMNSTHQGNTWTMQVVDFKNKKVTINTNEYQKM